MCPIRLVSKRNSLKNTGFCSYQNALRGASPCGNPISSDWHHIGKHMENECGPAIGCGAFFGTDICQINVKTVRKRVWDLKSNKIIILINLHKPLKTRIICFEMCQFNVQGEDFGVHFFKKHFHRNTRENDIPGPLQFF